MTSRLRVFLSACVTLYAGFAAAWDDPCLTAVSNLPNETLEPMHGAGNIAATVQLARNLFQAKDPERSCSVPVRAFARMLPKAAGGLPFRRRGNGVLIRDGQSLMLVELQKIELEHLGKRNEIDPADRHRRGLRVIEV